MYQYLDNKPFNNDYRESLQDGTYELAYKTKRIFPIVLNSDNYQEVNQLEYPASPNFYRGPTHSEYYVQDSRDKSSSYFKIMNEIKPRLDDIFTTQVSANKYVEKGLQQLKDIHSRLSLDFQNNHQLLHKQPHPSNSYLYQINRIIDEIIINSEQQNIQFKASLQNLKNANTSLLNEDIQEHNIDNIDDESRIESQITNNKYQIDGNFDNFLDNISNIQSRLFSQIITLRQQKLDAINELNIERQKYYDLQRRYINLERNYRRLLQDNKRQIQQKVDRNYRQNIHFDKSTSKQRLLISKKSKEHMPSNTIRTQINDIQLRLRDASVQKIQLQKQINYFKRPVRNQQLEKQIKLLDNQLEISQRKAANLFPYKTNNDRLKQQLQKIKHENNQLRKQTGFRDNSLNKQNFQPLTHFKQQQDNYQKWNQEQQRQRSGSHSKVNPCLIQNNGQKTNQYKQFLYSIRNMNR